VVVHLIDGTYELFRHFYGLRRFTHVKGSASRGVDRPYGAIVGVLQTVLQIVENENGAAYIGVATDHVIESFRNRLWADYKTGAGIEPALLAQFHPLEEALAAMGVVVWPMVELEADDALASAAHLASKDKKVQRVAIWTPDKDLAQCVRGTRVVTVCRARTSRREAARSPSRLSRSREAGASVLEKSEIDGRRKTIRDAAGIREKFGVSPQLIPDLLALVGDAADGYPGILGIGARTAAQLLNRYGPIENFPPDILGKQRDLALLFKKLATLRTDAPLFKKVETLRWRGATPGFAAWAERMKAPRLLERCEKAAGR
jgi:5'-3' exonuclease